MTVLCDGRRLSQEMMRPTFLARSRVLFRPVLSNSVPRVQAVEASSRQAQNRLPRIGISSHRLARCAASEATASWGPYLTSLVDKCSALDSHMKALSEEQRVAVYDNEKVVRVIAGPGSGKTRVLTARVALLLLSGIKPENFLILTFTNKASKELKERLTNVMGEEEFNDLLKYMWIGTFHAMASKILRREIEHLKLGYRRNYTILDTDDTHRVVYEILMKTVVLLEIPEGASSEDKKAIRKLNSDTKLKVRQKAKKYGSLILRVKDIVPDIHKLSPFEIYAQAKHIPIPRLEFSRIYAAYHRVTRKKNTLDFGDMISLSYALLDKNPKIRQKYVSKFQHILVDEVQDTDNCQYRLLKLLASARRAPNEPNTNSLFVVGDPNQAIYGFRGANMQNMAVNLQKDFGTQMSSQNLRDNYRSVPMILRAAEAVLCENIATPLHQKLNAMRRADQGTLEVHQFYDEKRESRFVANKLKELNMEGIPYNEMGVLFRTKSIARNLEQSCARAGVPYRSLSGVAFWERREVKDIMCFLRFVCNPDDELAFERIVNTPTRGIGPVAYDRLKAWAEENTEEGFPRGLVADLESEFLESTAVNNIFDELEVNFALQDLLEKEPNKIVPEVSNGWKNLKLSKAAFRGLNCIRSLFVFVRSLATHKNAFGAVRGLVLGVGYINYILEGKFGDGDPTERELNVSILQNEARDLFEDQPGLHHLEEFVQSAVLWSDNDTSNEDKANLATMHAAKGLEFKVVFICGFEDGLIPLSHEGSCDIAEETRLAYVAMSRAKDQLYVTHTKFRTRFSKFEKSMDSKESRYLNQIRTVAVMRNH